MKHKRIIKNMVLFAAISASSSVLALSGVNDEDILNDAQNTSNILSSGIGLQGQRFSPLTKINKDTIKNLTPAYALSLGGEKQRGQESQPLIHNGKIFFTGSYSRAFAADVKTGKELWQYDHRLPEGILPCCDVVNRGGALYGNLFIFGTLDAKLVALDQETGKVVWKKKLGDYKAGYSYTAAPIIVKGKRLGAAFKTFPRPSLFIELLAAGLSGIPIY